MLCIIKVNYDESKYKFLRKLDMILGIQEEVDIKE
jgi:hypothetical protein